MDDGSPIGYLACIVLLLIGSAYFAGTEIALASVNRIRMMSRAANGDRRAKRVLYILDHFDKALTTLLIGNNVMHIGTASLATVMATKLWGVGSVGVTTIVTTFVVFFAAETLPKRFAKACSEPYSLMVSGPMLFLMKIMTPLTFVFSKISALASKPFKKQEEEPTVTEDELYDIMETVAEEGVIDEEKTELVQNALEFSDICARDVMTPWKNVLTINMRMPQSEILSVIQKNSHSRLPVVDAEGNVTGLLHIRKYLKAYLLHESLNIADVVDDVTFVESDKKIDDLLPAMSGRRTQIAVVVDGDGQTLGIITVEDILEELVGEIYDEDDKVAPAAAAETPAAAETQATEKEAAAL